MSKLGIIYKGEPSTDTYQELTFEETWGEGSWGHSFTKDEWQTLCKQYPDLMKNSKWEPLTDKYNDIVPIM